MTPRVTTPLSESTPEETPLMGTLLWQELLMWMGMFLRLPVLLWMEQIICPGTTVVIAGKGTFILSANGDYTLTPDKDYNGSVPSVTIYSD